MNILHIITGLGDGGAEHTLYKICKYDTKNKHIVISLTNRGKYFSLFKKLGIEVYNLNINFFSIYKFFYLVKLIGTLKPDIVQTWLVHADFLGSIAARLAGFKNIVWNIRYSKIQFGKAKFTTILILKILAKLSYFIPQLIIIVSKKAKKIYKNEGYDDKKFLFIPNGYDLLNLKPNSFKKSSLLDKIKIKIKNHTPRIGYVARYDPLKDHINLLKALSLIRLKKIGFFCLLVGNNINNNISLNAEIKKLKLTSYVKLMGPTKNVSKIMKWLDVHVQSSRSEGFPNVIAEAMAVKTPCVVTNVGDSSYIVGNTGWVVPADNSTKLAIAIESAIKQIRTKEWSKRRNRARARIRDKFSMGKMIKSYNKGWFKVYNKNLKNN